MSHGRFPSLPCSEISSCPVAGPVAATDSSSSRVCASRIGHGHSLVERRQVRRIARSRIVGVPATRRTSPGCAAVTLVSPFRDVAAHVENARVSALASQVRTAYAIGRTRAGDLFITVGELARPSGRARVVPFALSSVSLMRGIERSSTDFPAKVLSRPAAVSQRIAPVHPVYRPGARPVGIYYGQWRVGRVPRAPSILVVRRWSCCRDVEDAVSRPRCFQRIDAVRAAIQRRHADHGGARQTRRTLNRRSPRVPRPARPRASTTRSPVARRAAVARAPLAITRAKLRTPTSSRAGTFAGRAGNADCLAACRISTREARQRKKNDPSRGQCALYPEKADAHS
jgi:hypothetical protein